MAFSWVRRGWQELRGDLAQRRRTVQATVPLQLALVPICLLQTGCPIMDTLQYPRHPQAPQVVGRLLGSDSTLAVEAATEIKALGPGAMPELRDRMRTAEGDARIQIIKTAADLKTPTGLLVQIFEIGSTDKHVGVRNAVALYAASAKEVEAQLVPILQPLIADESAEVRATTLLTLSSFTVPSAIPPRDLVTRTHDSDIRVAATACALAIASKDPVIKGAALESLARLIGALNDPQPATRATILYALGQYGSQASAAVQPVIKLVHKEKVPEVKLQAALALIRFNAPQSRTHALPVLRQFSTSDAPALREAAATALRTYGPPQKAPKPTLK